MPDMNTWYSVDELLPKSGVWLLVADIRYDEPMKARYHHDTSSFEYDSKSCFGSFVPDGYAYAWTPIPRKPGREYIERGQR